MFALVLTVAGLLVGLVFKWKPVGQIWARLGWWTLVVSVIGIILLLRDYMIWRLWQDDVKISGLGQFTLLGYFLTGFPMLYFCSKKEPNQSPHPTLAFGRRG